MRILVTGSRTWPSPELIIKALTEAWAVNPPGEPFVVVHGDCPSGADAQADRVVKHFAHLGWNAEPHPAEWRKYGMSAGYRRNVEMVRLGADVCLAFISQGSRGASHCALAAERAGIPVRRFEC